MNLLIVSPARLPSVKLPPLIVPVAPAPNTVDPEPDIVPVVHENERETSSSPAPVSVPPVSDRSCTLDTEGPANDNDPPERVNDPVGFCSPGAVTVAPLMFIEPDTLAPAPSE